MFKNKDSYPKFQLTPILYLQVVHDKAVRGLALRTIGLTDFWKCVSAFSSGFFLVSAFKLSFWCKNSLTLLMSVFAL